MAATEVIRNDRAPSGICCEAKVTTDTTKVVRQRLFFLRNNFLQPSYVAAQPGSFQRVLLRSAWGWMAGQTHKIPGPLARTMIDVAQKSLDLWRRDERAAFRFARLVMSRPSMLRNSVEKLPWPVAEACWRLTRILEYLAELDEEESLLVFTTAPSLLEGTGGHQKPRPRQR